MTTIIKHKRNFQIVDKVDKEIRKNNYVYPIQFFEELEPHYKGYKQFGVTVYGNGENISTKVGSRTDGWVLQSTRILESLEMACELTREDERHKITNKLIELEKELELNEQVYAEHVDFCKMEKLDEGTEARAIYEDRRVELSNQISLLKNLLK